MKLPCRTCGSCGRVSDLSVTTCQCGADLSRLSATLTEPESLAPEQQGQIHAQLPFFVQKCSACGSLNFTLDKAKPVRVCGNCHKARVAFVAPVPYQEPEKEKTAEDLIKIQPVAPAEAAPEEEADTSTPMWANVLSGVQKAVSDTEEVESAGGWGALLGDTVPQKGLVLTSIGHGRYTFALQPADAREPVMLGRSATASDFLGRDPRVSNRHCAIWCVEGRWFVKDNHSSNGTFLNHKDLGLDGQSSLSDGDVLTLGHTADAISFTLSFTE